jgi:hypothetical protein
MTLSLIILICNGLRKGQSNTDWEKIKISILETTWLRIQNNDDKKKVIELVLN